MSYSPLYLIACGPATVGAPRAVARAAGSRALGPVAAASLAHRLGVVRATIVSMSSLLRGNAAALALAAACAPSPPRTIAPPASELAAPPAASLADRCPEQTARLARIDDAIAGRPEDPALHYFRATSVATCGAAAETAAALRRVAELGDGFLPTPDLGFRAVWDDPAVKAEIESMTAALSQVGVDAPMIAIEPDGTASDRRPLSFGRCAHRDPERHESRPRDHGTPRRVGNSGDRRDHALDRKSVV